MSTPKKNRAQSEGKPESELTRLKDLWALKLSDDAREYWRSLFVSSTGQPEIRAQLLSKLKVNLRFDSLLTKFRLWVEVEDQAAAQAERMEQNRTRIQREHPDWTKDDVLSEVIKVSAEESLASGDHELGLKTVAVDTKRQTLDFDREKFKEALRTKIQSGLDAIMAEAGKNPKVKAAVEAINAATEEKKT